MATQPTHKSSPNSRE